MALNNFGLGFLLYAKDFASKTFGMVSKNLFGLERDVDRGTQNIGRHFHRLGVGMGLLAAGGLAVAGSFGMAGAAGEFEQGIASIGAVANATTKQLQMLEGAGIQAGLLTQFSPTEATSGMQSLVTAGQTLTQSVETLIPVLDLAAGSLGQLGVSQAATAVVGTLNSYGSAASEAGNVTDRLLRITQLTNFQTLDFEAGLSKAAASGAVYGQSLNDVLITMGLLRNRNIDASSASTGYREAVRRLASDQRAQAAVQKVGVAIFDEQTGKMRSALDVMSDFADKIAELSDKEKGALITRAFGARGLLAFNAAQEAAVTTVIDGVEVTLRGRDAIAALRGEMENAEGTAAKFRERLLATYEGQKTLLAGTLQTMAIVFGRPFAKVLRPVFTILIDVFNALIKAFQSIPEPVQEGLVMIVTVGGALLALVGGILVGKAAIGLLLIGIKALGLTLAGLVATMLPAIGILAFLGLVISGFVVALKSDIGGIGSFFERIFGRIRLFVDAIRQLFSQGGFSGAVLAELSRAENQGVMRFAIRIYQIGFRIKRFFEGLMDGFGRGIDRAGPVFEQLVSAFSELGQALGIVDDAAAGVASLHSDDFASSGASVGDVLARVFSMIVIGLTHATRFIAGIVGGFRWMGSIVGAAFSFLGGALGEVGATIRYVLKSVGLLGEQWDTTGGFMKAFGTIAGAVIGGVQSLVLGLLGVIVKILSAVIRFVAVAFTSLASVGAGIIQLFSDPAEGIRKILKGLLGGMMVWVASIGSVFGVGLDDVESLTNMAVDAIIGFFSNGLPAGIQNGLASVGRFFEDTWSKVVGSVSVVGARISTTLGGAWDLVKSGLSRAWSLAVRTGKRILGFYQELGRGVINFFLETIPQAVEQLASGVKGFFSPVFEFVQRLAAQIGRSLSQLFRMLMDLAAKIPEPFRPKQLTQMLEVGQATVNALVEPILEAETPTARPLVDETGLAVRRAAATSRQAPPTVSASPQRNDQSILDAIAQVGKASLQAIAAAGDRPIAVELNVDGDKLARATMKANQASAARSFVPIPT